MAGPQQSTLGDAEAEKLRLLERGLDYLAQDNTNFARLVLKERTRKFGEDVDGMVHLAMTYSRENNHEKALALYRKALALGEDGIGDEAGKAPDDLWTRIKARPYLRALHGLGLTLLELGRFDQSAQKFRRMLKLSPKDQLGVRQLLGLVHHRQGRLTEAIRVYRKFRADPMVAYNLALAYYSQGALENAVLVLRQALLANPYVPAALLEGPPEPFDYPHRQGTEEPEYALDYAGSCGDLWERAAGAFTFMRAVISAPAVAEEGVRYREIHGRLDRERRRAEKEKLAAEVRRMASARRLKRTLAPVIDEVRKALEQAGVS